MASEEIIPTVTAEDIDENSAKVVVLIPGLTTKGSMPWQKKTPDKNCPVNVNLKELSLEVTADVKGKKYRYCANKLPSSIDKSRCKIEYKKEQIILNLFKTEKKSWAVYLSKYGLDQEPMDS